MPASSRIIPTGLVLGTAVSAALLGFSAAGTADTKYLPLAEVKPGLKGHGLTVLQGTTPERFDIEVVAVLQEFRPDQSLIIVKTPHPRLDVAKTVAGMSGSPVYVNNRLIGAYAYGWYFNQEPIAGVTPIEDMLEVLNRPIPYPIAPGPGRAPLPGGQSGPAAARPQGPSKFIGTSLGYNLNEHTQQVASRVAPVLAAPSGMGVEPASTAVMVAGVGPKTFQQASQLLEPVGLTMVQAGGAGGKIDPNAPTKYVDGGVITVQLVRGDISISGLGTVTHVVGDKLVAFGHPMINGGVENLPTAVGKVHWILAASNRSFKIGEPTRPIGALINDRQAAIVVDTKNLAPTFPVEVSVKGVPGARKTSWSMEVAQDRFFAPNFTAIGIGAALETTTSERLELTWRADSKLTVEGYGTLEFQDFGSGSQSPIGPHDFGRSRLVNAMGALLNNDWEEVRISGVETTVTIQHLQDVSQLLGAQALESEIDVGQPARVRLTLERYRGQRETKVVEIPIPPQLAGQSVAIRFQPGYQLERPVALPESIRELFDVLPKLYYPGESLVASFRVSTEAAAAYRGQIATSLPPGAADTLRSESQTIAPEVFAVEKHIVIPTQGFVTGQATVQVEVREVLR